MYSETFDVCRCVPVVPGGSATFLSVCNRLKNNVKAILMPYEQHMIV